MHTKQYKTRTSPSCWGHYKQFCVTKWHIFPHISEWLSFINIELVRVMTHLQPAWQLLGLAIRPHHLNCALSNTQWEGGGRPVTQSNLAGLPQGTEAVNGNQFSHLQKGRKVGGGSKKPRRVYKLLSYSSEAKGGVIDSTELPEGFQKTRVQQQFSQG